MTPAPPPAVLSAAERTAARAGGLDRLRRVALASGAWTGYRTGTVTEARARTVLLALALDAQQAARDRTQDLVEGRIGRNAWYRGMRADLVPGLYAAALAATGQTALDPPMARAAERRIAGQIGYLRRFQRDLATGATPLDGRALVRADLYGAALWTTGQETRRDGAVEDGNEQERAIVSSLESCPGCLDRAAEGWQPIGTLAPLGDSPCRSRCRCSWLFR